MLTFEQFLQALEADYEQREHSLRDRIAAGVPTDEYKQMCGRYREVRLCRERIRELFTEMAKREEEDMVNE